MPPPPCHSHGGGERRQVPSTISSVLRPLVLPKYSRHSRIGTAGLGRATTTEGLLRPWSVGLETALASKQSQETAIPVWPRGQCDRSPGHAHGDSTNAWTGGSRARRQQTDSGK
jgi:hypothetical protein